jgi:hypothetical protein
VSSGTTCGAATCNGSNQFVDVPTCNGSGSCVPPAPKACGNYLCTTSPGCPTNVCNTSADCLSGNYCDASNHCVAQQTSGPCTSNNQCAAGLFCTDGYCCNVASCVLSCLSCGVPTLQGTCNPVPPGGTDPTGTCTGMQSAPTSCGPDGLCDGNGGCESYGTSTVCQTSCSSSQGPFLQSFCTGSGTCDTNPLDAQSTDCPSLICDNSLGCQ